MDEKSNIFDSASCPSVELLSIFLDEPSDLRVAEHVSSCEKCQAILADYDQIDRIQRERSAAPANLSRRIQQALPRQPSIHYSGAYFWLRFAAGLTVLATAAGLLTYVIGFASNESDSTLAVAEPVAIGEHLSKVEQALPDEMFSLTDQMRLQGNIETDSLHNVSTGPKLSSTASSLRKFRIGSQVEHIWLVDSLSASKQSLQQLAAAVDCPLTWQEEDGSEAIKANISGSDTNIQSLVNTLKDQEWALLSPAWPQPHAESRTVLTGNQIQYRATIVKKE
jgi:hypothetical protein